MELNSIADALSGLQANQSYMDVVGNNIANVNTTAYKTQSIRFADLLNQSLSYGTQATANLEGINPFQVGMGVGQGSIDLINSQGAVQDTGRLTDMAIQGNGYFVVNNGQQNLYTRDGSFTVAPDGTLESGATGMTVQGWLPNSATGVIDTTAAMQPIKIPVGSQTAAATTTASLAGNLDAGAAAYSAGPPPTGGTFSVTMTAYDSQGASHDLQVVFTKSGTANTWNYTVQPAPGTTGVSITSGGTGTLTFDTNGKLTAPSTPPKVGVNYGSQAAAGNVAVDFSGIGQLAGTSSVNVATIDGSAGGSITTFSVGKNGIVTAVYSNGSSKPIAQLALADFRNPDGLIRQGDNLYAQGVNSGPALLGQADSGNLGSIQTGQLEGSNVDLAAQFGQMIQAQQGFNANTKVITTTNNMLQSVISIVP